MIRNLKALGLGLIVAVAFSAVAASAASAVEYHSSTTPTTLFGVQSNTHEFGIAGIGGVTCKVAEFSGTQTGTTAKTVTITPTYKECTAFGDPTATVNMTGCDFLFNQPTGSAPTYTGTVNVVCPTGKTIDITFKLGSDECTLTIPGQTGLGTVSYTNNKPHVDVSSNVSKITYSRDGTGLCTTISAEATNGTYKGNVTLKGNAGAATIFVE